MSEIGIDIVELDRIVSVSPGFVERVLSAKEMKLYESYSESRKIEFLGGRFAAKEAIIKCLSDIEIPDMKEIEILNNENGKPIAKYKDYNIKLSISHEKHYACAVALLQ